LSRKSQSNSYVYDEEKKRNYCFSIKGPPVPIPSTTRRPPGGGRPTTPSTSGSFPTTTGCTWTAVNKTET